MIGFYQLLNVEGTNKVLILQINELDIIPNMGEYYSVNEVEFVVFKVKHSLNTATMTSDVEVHLMTEELFDQAITDEIKYEIDIDPNIIDKWTERG